MPIIINDIVQGTPEWLELRRCVLSVSHFSEIITTKGEPSKSREKLIDALFDEIISGEVKPSFKNEHMQRGNDQESEACKAYEFITDNVVEHVGFIFLDENRDVGYSPDGLVGSDGIIEIKTALPHIQRDRLTYGWSEAEHKQQIQGGLWVSGREWCDRVSYCRNMKPLIERFYRNEEFIKNLIIESKLFVNQLNKLISQYKI